MAEMEEAETNEQSEGKKPAEDGSKETSALDEDRIRSIGDAILTSKASDDKIPDDPKGGDTTKPDNKLAINEDLLARAERLGLTKEDVENIGDENLVRTVLNTLHRTISANAAKKSIEKEGADSRLAAEKKQEPAEIKPAPYKPRIEFDADFEPELATRMTELQKQYDTMLDELRAENAAIKKEFKSIVDNLQKEQSIEYAKELDRMFISLGEPYKDIFGTSGAKTMKMDSREFANRMAVCEEMDDIERRAIEQGKEISTEECFKRAVYCVFGDRIKEIVRKEIAGKLQARSKTFLSKPTDRKMKDVRSPETRAIEKVAEKMRSMDVPAE